jgi:hypothetical protein
MAKRSAKKRKQREDVSPKLAAFNWKLLLQALVFFLLSIHAWLDVEEKKSTGYLLSIFYYLAAMLAKTSTVMLPLTLLLYCWWKRGRVTR